MFTTSLHSLESWVDSKRPDTVHPGESIAEFQDSTAVLDSIKVCGLQKDLHLGCKVHAHCVKSGLLQQDIYVGTALLGMYAKCSALAKAQEIFDELPIPDVASWNVLISGYTQHGLGHEALHCYERLQEQGVTPSAITYVCLLKACGKVGEILKGEQIHVEASRQGLLENNVMICTAVVDMYAKCGALERAQEVFDELPLRDVVSWNVLIAGYAQNGLNNEVLRCFDRMRAEGLVPTAVTYVCVLKACGSIRAAKIGEEIHEEVSKHGGLKKNLILGTALVDMYAQCGALAKAQKVFDDLLARDVALWNALISGYSQYGENEKALSCYRQMQEEMILPDAVTLVSVLKACGNLGASEKGKEVHGEVCRQGLLGKDLVLSTALVDMYAKCGELIKARLVFDELPARDVTSWTALIAGYAQQQLGEEALICFSLMQEEGVPPNVVTFTCIFNACGSIGAIEKGKEIHADVGRQGLLEKSVVLGTALVDMYAKFGLLAKAKDILNKLPARDVTCWTALMAGYAQHGLFDEVLVCFERMREEGLSPDVSNYLCIVRTCGSMGILEKGKQIHTEMGRRGLLDKYTVLGIALLDMYAKCGALKQAHEVFDKLSRQDTVAWTALMAGYAQFGMASIVFDLFGKMIGHCVEPNQVTFVVLLNACSHAGLVEEGQKYFQLMNNLHSILSTLEHFTCMVDLFCRVGLFENAVSLIERVPSSNCHLLWLSLLSACGRLANEKLGRLAFDHAVQLCEKYAAAYVIVNNLYATIDMHE